MYIVVLITAANREEAGKIAQGLIKSKIAACVNIVEKINSVFWWLSKIEESSESLLIVKSKKSKLGKIIKAVKSLHSYTVPEIIALPIVGGEKNYLGWIDESLR